MKKNATIKTKKNTKNTGKLPNKKALNPKLKKTIKATKLKISITPATKRTGTKTQNASKTPKNTPKKARERVTVSNYQRLAMRTCLPQCKCWEYAIPELASEWHEALAKIEGTRAKLVRLDGNAHGGIAEYTAHDLDARADAVRPLDHDAVVGAKIGLALGAVYDQELAALARRRIQLHAGREAGAAHAADAGLFDAAEQILARRRSPVKRRQRALHRIDALGCGRGRIENDGGGLSP